MFVFLFAATRLFQFQVVDGATYLADAEKNSLTEVTIVAARGEIVDRNGVPLTKNKAIFNVEFDYTFLKKGTSNEIIYNLINLFEKRGEKWIDELPITLTEPYEFLPDREEDVVRLKKKLDVNPYASVNDCMDNMMEDFRLLKFEKPNGKCAHCDLPYDECTFEGYDQRFNRLIIGVRYQMLLKDFSKYNRFTFAEDVNAGTVALLREFSSDFVGTDIVERAKRTYLSGDVAASLIGSLGPIYADEYPEYYEKGYLMSDIVGKNGIEKAMESELRGVNGTMLVTQDSKGNVVEIEEKQSPVAGNTVKLTIDYEFQKEVQRLLAEYLAAFNETNNKDKFATDAAVVVLDVKSGGVLASVSYPYYDIDDYITNYTDLIKREDNPIFDRALNGQYRPGSSFKPVTATAGLELNKITPTTEVYCNRVYTYFDAPFRPTCLGHHNNVNVSQALNVSCNIFFYDVGRILGINNINKYAGYFGFGESTGLELPSKKGRLSSKEYAESIDRRWEQGDVVQAAIGQMYTEVTPLQMAIEAMTLANHGTRYNAHIVDSILSHKMKDVIAKKEPVIASKFEMSDVTFKAITDGMIAGGRNVRAPNQLTDLGYDVAIKTGSPEITKTKSNNDFIAFAPVNNPEIAISCLVVDGYNTNELLRRILVAYDTIVKGK